MERSTGRMRRNEIYQLARVVWAPGTMPGCTKTEMHEQAGNQPSMIVYQAAILRPEALHIPHSDALLRVLLGCAAECICWCVDFQSMKSPANLPSCKLHHPALL